MKAPTDCNPSYPVNAILLGGPMHGKRLNFEDKKDYTCVEGNLNAGQIPTQYGYNESKYKFCMDLGGMSLFLHEIATVPDSHRVPALLQACREDNAMLKERLRATVKEADEASGRVLDLEDEIGDLKSAIKLIRYVLRMNEDD